MNGVHTRIMHTNANDYRTRVVSIGCDSTNTRVCVNVRGCNNFGLAGATVTVSKGITVIGSGMTVTVITSLTLSSSGSGYTNGTGYSLGISSAAGSGASGTFDVVGGHVTNLKIINGGSGYQTYTTISITFPGAGAGTGASATATVTGQFCVGVTSPDTYTITVSKARFNTGTTSVSVPSCGTTIAASVSLTAASGYRCCLAPDPYATTLYYTDSYGTHIAPGGSVIYTTTLSGQACRGTECQAPDSPQSVGIGYTGICSGQLTLNFGLGYCPSGAPTSIHYRAYNPPTCGLEASILGALPNPRGPLPQVVTLPATYVDPAFGLTIANPVGTTVTVSE